MEPRRPSHRADVFDARTIDQSPASQQKPCDSARLRGAPVSTARTYAGSCTCTSCSDESDECDTSSMPLIGRRPRESATHFPLGVVWKAWAPPTYPGLYHTPTMLAPSIVSPFRSPVSAPPGSL